MNIKIKKAKFEDLENINSIYNQAVKQKFQTADTELINIKNRKKWFKEHENDKYPVFVATVNEKVIGWISFSPYRKNREAVRFTAEISYYIHNDFQKQGIGTKLIQFAIEKAPELSLKNIFAIVLEKNFGSITLLKKLNFEEWAFLPNIADFDGIECGHFFFGLRVQ